MYAFTLKQNRYGCFLIHIIILHYAFIFVGVRTKKKRTKKLNPKIPDHENSNKHIINMIKWKTFEKNLNTNNIINCALQIEMKIY